MSRVQNMTRMFTIVEIFCIFPIRYNEKLGKYEKRPFKWLYFVCIVSVATILTATLSILLGQWQQANIEEKVRLCFRFHQHLLSIAVMGTCHVKREILANTMNLYMEIENVLESCCHINYRSFFIFLVMKHTILIVFLNVFCYACNSPAEDCTFSTSEHLFSYTISAAASTSMCALLFLSHQQFRVLNASAANIVLNGNFGLKIALKTVTILHFKTVKVTNMVNDAYSFQIVNVLNFALVSVVGNIHLLLNNGAGSVALTLDVLWVAMVLMEAFALFSLASKVEYMADKTSKIVNMILYEDNPMLQLEKDIFLLQSQHQRLSLDACGLYKIDKKSFLRFGGTALTYIILMQGLNN